jgi:hypothetical protein
MSQPPRTPGDRWRDLMDGLADSVASAPDEDVIEEARDIHGDETRRAEEIRASMFATVDEFEADEDGRRVLPFVAPAPEPRRITWRLAAAAAAAAIVAGSLTFAALWRPGTPEVAVTSSPVVQAPLPPAPPAITTYDGSAKNSAPVEPSEHPAPPSNVAREHHRHGTPRTGVPPVADPSDMSPEMGTTTRWPNLRIGLANVKTVCVNFGPDTLSTTAHALRDEIAQRLGNGGFTPIDDQEAADSRLRITETSGGHFDFLFIADNQTVWDEPATVAGPTDVKATAVRIAERITSTVLDARQQTGASQ